MKKGCAVLVLISLVSFDAPPRLVRTKIAEDISIMIPKNFKPMDDLDFSQRYPSVRKPIGAYTNVSRDVDVSVNISATQWPDADLEIAQQFFKAGVMNMFDGVEMLSEGIHEVHGKRFIFFEFESRVKGEKMSMEMRDPVLNYTYIQYLIEPRRTLVFSFNCPRRLREDWQGTAQKMMKSAKVK